MRNTDSGGCCECRACGGSTTFLWKGNLLDLQVDYMRCSTCGYVQTEKPYWLDRAYAESINDSDTGILARNESNVQVVLATLFTLGGLHGRVVDFAGGYGILTRLLRDVGVDALWSDAFSKNLVARGFEHVGESATLVTAFESFEHFIDPGLELDKMLAIAPNVLLSTEIISQPVPSFDKWWYYGREHGQHIGFFTLDSLQTLAHGRKSHLVSDGRSYHLITREPVNGALWRSCVKLKKLLMVAAKRTLRSKTWADHLQRAAQSAGNPPD